MNLAEYEKQLHEISEIPHQDKSKDNQQECLFANPKISKLMVTVISCSCPKCSPGCTT